jgi:hypothetical protein
MRMETAVRHTRMAAGGRFSPGRMAMARTQTISAAHTTACIIGEWTFLSKKGVATPGVVTKTLFTNLARIAGSSRAAGCLTIQNTREEQLKVFRSELKPPVRSGDGPVRKIPEIFKPGQRTCGSGVCGNEPRKPAACPQARAGLTEQFGGSFNGNAVTPRP